MQERHIKYLSCAIKILNIAFLLLFVTHLFICIYLRRDIFIWESFFYRPSLAKSAWTMCWTISLTRCSMDCCQTTGGNWRRPHASSSAVGWNICRWRMKAKIYKISINIRVHDVLYTYDYMYIKSYYYFVFPFLFNFFIYFIT